MSEVRGYPRCQFHDYRHHDTLTCRHRNVGVTESRDPYTIFERARAVWSEQQYPNVVAYTVDVAAEHNGALQHRHYHEYWSANDGGTLIKPPVSDEQLEHPYVPSAGVNFMGWNIGGPREGTGERDFIGPPLLAPNYSFGINTYVPPSKLTPAQIVEQIRREYHDPSPQKVNVLAQQSGLKTIASVTSSAHAYWIELVGIEPDAKGRDFHLKRGARASARILPIRPPKASRGSSVLNRLTAQRIFRGRMRKRQSLAITV